MDQDTLRVILREAVRETATEVLQVLLEADRVALRSKHVFGAFLWEQERLLRAEAGNQLGPGGAFHTKGSGREVLPQPAPALRPAPGGRGGSGRGPVRCRGQSAQVRRGDEPAFGPPVLPRNGKRPHRPGA